MKRLLLTLTAALTVLSAGAQANIADARTYAIGQTVTIRGVALNGSELGSIRYIQDATAGIAAYGGPITGVGRGDSVTVTGPLIEFSGLLEISTVTNVTNHGTAVVFPTALQIPIPSAGESLESQLVEVTNVTFVQSGNFAGNTTYQITDGANTLDVRVNNGTNLVGTAIPSGQVTVRGPLGQFNANYQIIPRDLNDVIVFVAPPIEINVMFDGNTILNNSTVFIGNQASINVTIENQGTNTMNLTSASFSGTNAADFATTIAPGTVAGGGSNNYSITFTPTGTGSRFATLNIGSNDPDENPYVIYLEGVGTDNLATQPTSNPSSLSFSNVQAYTLSGSYNAGTNASKYIVLWKNGSAITGAPVDGTSYLRGDVVGDARVAYVGSGTGFTPRGIIANQNYYFAVYAFNGQGGFENYLTTSPATGTVSSSGENIGSYYSGISTGSATFNTDLKNLINPHTQITYFMYKQTMMNEFEVRDTTAGQSFVTCVYSGENKVFNDPFDWTPTGYSREHTFAHSWMPTWPCDNPEEPEYTDQHNLFPTNLAQANTPRSNLPLGDITGTVVYNYLEGSVGYDPSNQLVYEPRESHKGNAARAMMYMIICYDFPLSGDLDSDGQDADLIKTWHWNDLPDNREIARNEYIYDLQGNRNPFIDSVEYVCFIDFYDNLYDPQPCPTLGMEEKLQNRMVVYPVPSDDKIFVQVNDFKISGYQIVDMTGRVVRAEENISTPILEFQASEFGSGAYVITVSTAYGSVQKKMIVE